VHLEEGRDVQRLRNFLIYLIPFITLGIMFWCVSYFVWYIGLILAAVVGVSASSVIEVRLGSEAHLRKAWLVRSTLVYMCGLRPLVRFCAARRTC